MSTRFYYGQLDYITQLNAMDDIATASAASAKQMADNAAASAKAAQDAAAVATGGAVNADWNATSGLAKILNKPILATVATSGSYVDLINKPVFATVATTGSYADLTNKPALATVATSGSYTDLSNKPTIPTATSQLTNDSGFITSSGSINGMAAGVNVSQTNEMLLANGFTGGTLYMNYRGTSAAITQVRFWNGLASSGGLAAVVASNIDASGNTTGNAATATKLKTATTINGVSFDGSTPITINTADSTKEPALGSSDSNHYLTGARTWGDFGATVRSTLMGGLVTTDSSQVTGNDNPVVALGKLQAQINSKGSATADYSAKNLYAAAGVYGMNATDGQVLSGGDSTNGSIEIGKQGRTAAGTPFIDFHSVASSGDYDVRLIASGGNATTAGQGTLNVQSATFTWNGLPVTTGTPSTTSAASTIVQRDASGNIVAANLTQSSVAYNFDAVKAPGLYHYDGAFTGTKPPTNSANYRVLEMGSLTPNQRYTQMAFPWDSDAVHFRRFSDSGPLPWRTLIHDGTFNSYGQASASGTWPISVTGSAGSATTAGSVAWSGVTSKPTTLSGYGITDFVRVNITNGTDINTVAYQYAGMYRINDSGANKPAWNYGNMLTINGGGDTFGQIYIDYTNAGIQFRGGVVNGTSNNSAWRTLLHDGNSLNYPAKSLTGAPAYTNGTDGWWRSSGQAGWFNSDYAVGIFATEAGNVRTYNNASMIANTFYGSGGGLTGTAASLTAGNTTSISGSLGNSNVWTGSNYFRSNRNTAGDGGPPLMAYSDNGSGAILCFHRGGAFAVNMGLDSDNIIRIGGWSAPANLFQFYVDAGNNPGNFIASGNITAYSDERKKTNWRNVPVTFVSDWAKVKSGLYDRIDNGMTQAGLSAQSVQAVLPETVIEGDDGFLSLNYGAAAAVASVELAKEVVALRAEIAKQAALIKLLLEKVYK